MGRGRFSPLLLAPYINRFFTALYTIAPSHPCTCGALSPTRLVTPPPPSPSPPSSPLSVDGWGPIVPFVCPDCPFAHEEGLPCPQICTSPFDCRFKIPPTHEWACESCGIALWRATGPPPPPSSPPSLELVLGEISYALNTMICASLFLIVSNF